MSVSALKFQVGSQESILTYSQRTDKNLNYWYDGTIGAIKNGSNYHFYAPNGFNPAHTSGPMDDIANTILNTEIKIANVPSEFDYAAGGPIYKIDENNLLMFVHLERYPEGEVSKFYATYGLALSSDGGISFTNLGEIITHNKPYDPMKETAIMAPNCGASFAIRDGYFYVYFQDMSLADEWNALGVARASVDNVVNAALSGQTSFWYKYYNGGFTEPGLGGRSTQLCSFSNSGHSTGWIASTAWIAASYNTYLNKVILVASMYENSGIANAYITTTEDGYSNLESWTELFHEPYEDLYVSILGNGTDPNYSDKTFYLYYSRSLIGVTDGWHRWDDATMERRLITV